MTRRQRQEFGPWPDEDGPFSIVLEWEEIGGRLELAGLTIRPWAGVPVAPITTTTLRRMPLPEWRRQLVARWEVRARDDIAIRGSLPQGYETMMQHLGMADATPTEFATAMTGGPGRPAHWTAERLKEAARIYGLAYMAQQPPTAAVAAHFHLSAKGAAKVIGMARKANFLPPTKPGRPSWWNKPKREKRK